MKIKVLMVSLFALSTALIGSDTPQYRFSGQEAVNYLIRSGECRDCDLSNQDLRTVLDTVNRKYRHRCMFIDFSGANLTGAHLSGADLSCATMRGTNLTGANMTDANLSHAIMTDANMTGANLSNANMSGATMIRVTMTGANIAGADMTHAAGLSTAIGYTSLK